MCNLTESVVAASAVFVRLYVCGLLSINELVVKYRCVYVCQVQSSACDYFKKGASSGDTYIKCNPCRQFVNQFSPTSLDS